MMDLSIDMSVEQTQRVSPTLIAVNQILALSSQELQAAIKQEAEENPAFEVIEHQTCNICGEVLKHGVCTNCLRTRPSADTQARSSDEFSPMGGLPNSEYAGGMSYTSTFGESDDEFDPVALVASEPTLRERLMYDMRSVLSQSDFAIADYVLG